MALRNNVLFLLHLLSRVFSRCCIINRFNRPGASVVPADGSRPSTNKKWRTSSLEIRNGRRYQNHKTGAGSSCRITIGQPICCLLVFCTLYLVGCSHTATHGKVIFDMDTGKRTYTHNGINIKYIDRGSGPTMVLIHGFGASFYSWREIINKFSENYRVIAIDLKGFGLSDKPEDSNYSVKEQSNIVKSIIKINDLKDIILVGHSFGGAVSLVTCLDLIETDNPIKKLILLDSASL